MLYTSHVTKTGCIYYLISFLIIVLFALLGPYNLLGENNERFNIRVSKRKTTKKSCI